MRIYKSTKSVIIISVILFVAVAFVFVSKFSFLFVDAYTGSKNNIYLGVESSYYTYSEDYFAQILNQLDDSDYDKDYTRNFHDNLSLVKEHLAVMKAFDTKYQLPKVSYALTKMDYRMTTDRSSRQYKLLNASEAHTVSGHRYFGAYPLVAVSAKFGVIGDLIRITWADGSQTVAMIGEIKSYAHLDQSGIYHYSDGSVVEYVVDETYVRLPSNVKTFGDGVSMIETISK